jgi:Na+/H+ antiporter NhaD/arsenite permease-like protein
MTADMLISLAIFVAVLALILAEKAHRTILAMAGAVVMVAVGKLLGFYRESEALRAIDFNTIGLLLGMMIMVAILAPTGAFEYLALWAGRTSKGRPFRLVVLLGLVTSVVSMFLDNVTTVVVIAPVTIVLCEMFEVSPAPFLLSEALLSNIGGIATLIGDPPNIIIGSASGLSFNDFIVNSLPVVVGIWIASLFVLRYLLRKELRIAPARFDELEALDPKEQINDWPTARRTMIVFAGVVVLFVLQSPLHMAPAMIAFVGAAAALLWVRPDVHDTVQRVEWSVLVFFAGLFVMVGGLEASGLLEKAAQSLVGLKDVDPVLVGIAVIWVVGLLSAVVDNIPITIALIPVILGLRAEGVDVEALWWALAFGAGLGGNGTIIGASANVVVASLSERTPHPISSAYWTRRGLPTMLFTLVVASLLYIPAYYVLYAP